MTRWTHEPTIADEARASAVGYLRNERYMLAPEANRSYSEGAIWEEWQHKIGALAEISFAAMMGIENFLPSYNTHKGEPDVGDWEVRYGFSQDNGLPPTHMRFVGSVDTLTSPYVLILGGSEKRFKRSAANDYKAPAMTAVGWTWGNEVAIDKYFSGNNSKGKPVYMIPISDLRSMSEIAL
jgi:hypothetical protein